MSGLSLRRQWCSGRGESFCQGVPLRIENSEGRKGVEQFFWKEGAGGFKECWRGFGGFQGGCVVHKRRGHGRGEGGWEGSWEGGEEAGWDVERGEGRGEGGRRGGEGGGGGCERGS